jgi:hypothetical protein
MDNVKDKVSKLLAMGNDERTNRFEAEAALRQADKLMRKHNIDAAELCDHTGTKPVYLWTSCTVPAIDSTGRPLKKAPPWFGWLIVSIAKFTDCKVGYTYAGRHVAAKFSGEETDVEFAAWLCLHLRDDLNATSGTYPGDRADKDSFRKGYTLRIGARMDKLRAERTEAYRSTGTALVVVNDKIAQRDVEFGEQTYGKSRSVTVRANSGLAAGHDAGNRASLSRPIGHTAVKRLA